MPQNSNFRLPRGHRIDFGKIFEKKILFRTNLRKISILVKIFLKISILVKFSKIFDFGQNFRQI